MQVTHDLSGLDINYRSPVLNRQRQGAIIWMRRRALGLGTRKIHPCNLFGVGDLKKAQGLVSKVWHDGKPLIARQQDPVGPGEPLPLRQKLVECVCSADRFAAMSRIVEYHKPTNMKHSSVLIPAAHQLTPVVIASVAMLQGGF